MSKQMRRNWVSPSLVTAFLTGIVLIIAVFDSAPWKNHGIIQSDVSGYYSYLPATIIYQDLQFNYFDKFKPEYGNALWVTTTPDGKRIQKYTIGMSVLYTPLFLVAHALAVPLGFPADGYSMPYQVAIGLGGCIYSLLGLLLLRLLLLRYFREIIVAFILGSIGLTTNLYYYATYESAMSHAYSFFLFAAFLLCSIRWLENPSGKNTLLTGLLAGLILLVRPTNGLIFLVPAFYGITDKESLYARISFIKYHFGKILILIVIIILVIFPQLLYWREITGQWYYHAYVGEHFYFTNPHIIEGLFSYRKGWLIYTPLMFFIFPGFVFMKGKLASLRWVTIVFLAINIYVMFSWWCWWYGGGFGCRPIVESYALLAFPLGAFYEMISRRKRWIWITCTGILLYLTWLNIFQTEQKKLNVIHYDGMTRELYWMVFNDLYNPDDFWNQIKLPDYESALNGKDEKLDFRIKKVVSEFEINFDDTLPASFDTIHFHSAPNAFALNDGNLFSPGIVIKREDIPDPVKYNLRLRGSAFCYAGKEKTELLLVIQFQQPDQTPYQYFARVFKYKNQEKDEWHPMELDVAVPEGFKPGDIANVFITNKRQNWVPLDDMKVEILEVELY